LLDHATAGVGSTVYPGDILQTDSNGSIRLRFREAQLYMSADSTVNFEKSQAGVLRATLTRGAAGFSSGTNDLVEIDTPDGVIIHSRTGVPAHGRITSVKSGELLVSSIKGPFDITVDGVTQTIADGKSYQALISQDKGTLEPGQAKVKPSPRKTLKLVLFIGGLVGAAATGWYINQILDESPSTPTN
jgi:hypothetical protein